MFVESGLAESDEDFQVVLKESPRSIGSDGFRAWIDERYQKRVATHARPEDISFRHSTEPMPAGDVLAILANIFGVEVDAFKRRRHNSPLRAVAARSLMRYAGLSQRDVAGLLKVGSGAALCNQLNRLPEKLAKDRRLRRQVKQADEAISKAYHERAKKTDGPSL